MDECPWYIESKMTAHVVACPDPDTIMIFNDSMENLLEWMGQAITNPEIQNVMKEALKEWKNGGWGPQSAPYQLNLVEALYEQQILGWQACLKECLTI